MILVGKTRWIIETPIAKPAKNKKVLDERTGEMVIVPDGEPEYEWHVFGGVFRHPVIGAVMNMWSINHKDAAFYKDKDEADLVNEKILGKAAGGIVVEWEKSHVFKEGRIIAIPLTGLELETAKSAMGIDSKGKIN